ncbi:MAG: transglutaminase-like cysteine peptidase [Hyphomicrobiales bacterium]
MAPIAQAAEWQSHTARTAKASMHLTVYGETLPPIGYVQFCKAHAKVCRKAGGKTKRMVMTDRRWKELSRVNSLVNNKIQPVTDQELYNVPEHWAYPEAQGDCEDYVLLKKHYLAQLGWPREALLITVVLDQQNAGHAVLTVATDVGDLVLDNQNPSVLAWQDTPYRYIKRQSQSHPSRWVSLDPKHEANRTVTSGRLITKR